MEVNILSLHKLIKKNPPNECCNQILECVTFFFRMFSVSSGILYYETLLSEKEFKCMLINQIPDQQSSNHLV